MNKRLSVSLAFGLLLSIVLPAQVVRAADFQCRGGVETPAPAFVRGNLVVPAGDVCFAAGSEIRGNVKLEPGAHLIAREMNARGNLQGQGFLAVDMVGSRVGGNIQLERGAVVFIDDLIIGGNDVGGNVQIEGTQFTVDLNGDNFIDGNLKVIKNAASVDISRNRVRGHVEVDENTGGVTIANNVIGKHLKCERNRPAPIGGGNVADKERGQCAGL